MRKSFDERVEKKLRVWVNAPERRKLIDFFDKKEAMYILCRYANEGIRSRLLIEISRKHVGQKKLKKVL